MRTTLFVAFIVITAGICTSCQTESVIKLGMTENEVIKIMKTNDCKEAMSQVLQGRIEGNEFIPTIDHYYEVSDNKFIHFVFDEKTLELIEITYLGEHQEGQGFKFSHGFDPKQIIDIKEVNIAEYK